jgi:hypothetical protein
MAKLQNPKTPYFGFDCYMIPFNCHMFSRQLPHFLPSIAKFCPFDCHIFSLQLPRFLSSLVQLSPFLCQKISLRLRNFLASVPKLPPVDDLPI